MKYKNFILFLSLNFATLFVSQWVMAEGLNSDWYKHMAKAPWTPPGWFFGVAWFTIMTAFAVHLAQLSTLGAFIGRNRYVYALILILCVLWNVVFFVWQAMTVGVFVLLALALCVLWFTVSNYTNMRIWSVLMVPFIMWSFIATSLNMYSVIYG